MHQKLDIPFRALDRARDHAGNLESKVPCEGHHVIDRSRTLGFVADDSALGDLGVGLVLGQPLAS